MATVYLLMMLKDETARLARWIEHYRPIVPFSHMILLDNGSSHPETLDLLSLAEAHGARVVREHTSFAAFAGKGNVIAHYIREIDETRAYDFAIPLDCDEYLGLFTDRCFTTDPQAIHRYLDGLRREKRALRIPVSMFNDPSRNGLFWGDRHFHKGFLRARTIKSLDNGFHEPGSRLESGSHTTRLFYFHEHNLPYDQWRQNALNKLNEVVDTSDPVKLANYLRQPTHQAGQHLLKDLRGTRQDYIAKYLDRIRIGLDPRHPEATTIHTPDGRTALWDGDLYIRRHRDVASDRTYGALMHYIIAGTEENRPLY